MNTLFERARQEILSFCTGEPIIATLRTVTESTDEYNLQIYVRSITDPVPTYIQSVQLQFFLPHDYINIQPIVRLYNTKLYHPNFTASGEWTDSAVHLNETMEVYMMRLVRVLQYKEINTEGIANRNAMAWYNVNPNLFPTDRTNYNTRAHIHIKRVNSNELL